MNLYLVTYKKFSLGESYALNIVARSVTAAITEAQFVIRKKHYGANHPIQSVVVNSATIDRVQK